MNISTRIGSAVAAGRSQDLPQKEEESVPLELIVGLENEFREMTPIGQRLARWMDRMVVSPAGLLHMCVTEGASPVLNRLVDEYAGLLAAKGTGEGTEARVVMERYRAHDDMGGVGDGL